MPLQYLDNSYGNMMAAGQMGQGIGNLLFGNPQYQQMAMQLALREQALQNQAMLNAAHSAYYKSQADSQAASRAKDEAETSVIANKLKLLGQLDSGLRGIFRADLTQPSQTNLPFINFQQSAAGPTLANAAEDVRLGKYVDVMSPLAQLGALGAPQQAVQSGFQVMQGIDPAIARMIATGDKPSAYLDKGSEGGGTAVGPGYAFIPRGQTTPSWTNPTPTSAMTQADMAQMREAFINMRAYFDNIAKIQAAQLQPEKPLPPETVAPYGALTNSVPFFMQGPGGYAPPSKPARLRFDPNTGEVK